jgi:hypothetical protein
MSNPHTPLHAIGPSPTGTHYVLEGRRAFASTDTQEDAALIVRAVNSHAVLVEALQKIFALTLANHCDRDEALEEIRSNIRAALAQLDKP